ncbi:hypothetical protein HCH_03017 [Hahella chejuensis KCTC 2396]|uniref:Uncharacterized protein n=1 Tax=Hahella chejuensis (strain KCTC 2396) TaxID=349521 RepID=Q2SHU0_HAHCH|nr:hypothetical protein [Hahella chejuensis]ABC29784.1 hypothetical protein HCH_03017 [Hahella chejuensis KCTC 2396]
MLSRFPQQYRWLIKPLLALWLLCASFVACAGAMAPVPGASQDASQMQSGHEHHGGVMQVAAQDDVKATQASGAMASMDCCDEHESATGAQASQLLKLMLAVTIFIFWLVLIARVIRVCRTRYRNHKLDTKPPSLQDVNCTYLK